MNLSSVETSIYHFLQRSPFDLGYFHPYFVDFAVVLPVMALFFHFVSVLTVTNESVNRGYQNGANLMFFGSFVMVILAYLSGIAQKGTLNAIASKEAQAHFDAHASLGTYLALAFCILFCLKIISLLVKKDALRYLFGTLFFFIVLLLIYQDVLGVGLVYDYGVGVSIAE